MIDIEHQGFITKLYLNDPDSLNSLSIPLSKALVEGLKEVSARPQTRCLIVSGRGRMFCSGGNLKEFFTVEQPLDEYIDDAMDRVYNPVAAHLASLAVPVICAVNGPAVGAGVAIALNADFTLMARSAWFKLPFVPSLGVVPDFGCSWFLGRRLPRHKAMELMLGDAKISAEEAASCDLIYRAVADDQLEEQALALATKISQLPVDAVRMAKDTLVKAPENSFAEQLQLEREYQVACFCSGYFKEGLAAFKEKRPAKFSQ
jgi:2-(1,2-epoxy-1,2-dihydrophenyl)acetyl-CoA isomerase